MIKLFYSIIISQLVFGVIAVLSTGYFFHKSVNTKSWPSVQGIIISSKIVKVIKDGKKKYYPEVNYEYLVDSISYKGNGISIGTITTEAYAKKVTTNYPLGKNVIVFYNIEDPSEALLEVGVSPVLYWILALGIIFILIACVLILFKEKILLMIDRTSFVARF